MHPKFFGLTAIIWRSNVLSEIKVHFVKGALLRIISISLNSQNIYLCHRKPTNIGPFLLTIAILVQSTLS